MKILKRLLLGLFLVVILAGLGFVFWAETPAKPTSVALRALESDAQVTVTQYDGFLAFAPATARTSTGFIFYPGGRVDYRAYAPVLHMIAAQGYLVAVVKLPLNLAFFEVNAADKVLSAFPDVQHWAVGGHSLGGVAAALYAKDHPDTIQAIAFWASYPADDALKNTNLSILSIYGSNDGLATVDKIEASKALLPAHTQYVSIAGGDHAQFGSYGPQSGDNPASISAEEQWSQVAEATVRLLAALVK